VRTAQALGAQPAQAGAAYLADRGGLPMVETLFAQQAKWAVRNPLDPLLAIAKQAGFTQQTFDACINNKDQLNKVQQVRDRASQKFKIKATPTFFINGELHEGGMSMEELDKAIEPYLKT
jgi:protein-disulfide isomerase